MAMGKACDSAGNEPANRNRHKGDAGCLTHMVAAIGAAYSAVFAPELFVLVCILAGLGYESRQRRPDARAMLSRLAVIGFGWVVAFLIYRGVPRLVGPLPPWGPDATGSVGLFCGLLVIRVWWRRFEWGETVPEVAAITLIVTVPHLLVTPVWDVSSHVLYAVTPAASLTVIDRRFGPLLVIALGMVIARPLAGAHTWAQSVGGLALGLVVAYGWGYREALWGRLGGSTTSE